MFTIKLFDFSSCYLLERHGIVGLLECNRFLLRIVVLIAKLAISFCTCFCRVQLPIFVSVDVATKLGSTYLGGFSSNLPPRKFPHSLQCRVFLRLRNSLEHLPQALNPLFDPFGLSIISTLQNSHVFLFSNSNTAPNNDRQTKERVFENNPTTKTSTCDVAALT